MRGAKPMNTFLSGAAKITLKALYDSIDKFKVIKGGIKFGIDMAVTGGLGAITNLAIKEITKKAKKVAEDVDEETMLQAIKDKLDYKEVREDIREFREKFAELIEEAGIKKLVIFVDELDRCNPATILDTLEAMRLFLFSGNVSFVIGADERHVTYAIRSKFDDIEGINMDIGKEYQEKLIQYPIRIPCMNKDETEFYIMCLLSENELNETEFDGLLKFLQAKRKQNPLEFSITMEILKEYDERIATKLNDSLVLSKQLSGILTQGLNGNPRQCKRFLNTLDMRQKMANYKNVTLKSNVLAKIMEVEYFQTSLFRKMVNLLGDNMLKTELEGFETDQEDKINALDPWKNELWVKKWMKAKPMLSEEKLENYFYFMRASAKDNIFTSVEKMSEEAKKIFEGISKHSDLAFNQAKMAVDKISVFDQHQILDGLYQDVISDDKNTLLDRSLDESYENMTDDEILAAIRQEHLKDSTVTIVLIGSETANRKWIDWEIYSSLRPYGSRSRNGLLGIYLPTAGETPARLQDNIDSGYAVTMEWENISWQLESKIDEAFNNRGKSDLVRNSRKRRERNS